MASRGGAFGVPVHRLFREQAAARPDALAVAASDGHLTYGQLERRSNQLANRLRALGVGRDVPVGLCADRSSALVVGAVGIAASGGAHVALDPCHPEDRLRLLLRDSGAAVVVTRQRHVARLRGADATVVVLDDADSPLDLEPTVAPPDAIAPDDLAYIVYTSGSSGAPKGVMVEHHSLGNLVAWHRGAFDIAAEDRGTLIASPAYDASVWELWPCLAAGASLHVPIDPVRTDPVRLRDWLIEQAITVSFLPTSLAEDVISLSWPAEVPLRYLLTGGDTLHRYPAPGLPFVVVNNYGPTEATVVVTSGSVPVCDSPTAPPGIGRPIPGVRIHIVDAHLRPVEAGEVGELLVGGPAVARGYLNRPHLSAQAFIADPFGDAPTERVYRTGDLVRRRPDGELEFVGRVDDQVKIRGHRIEPGEIVAALSRHPGVRASAVVARATGSSEKELVAYVVAWAAGATRPAMSELRAHVARLLPLHMVPALFVWLDELPMTPTGKVARAALPAPDLTVAGAEDSAAAAPQLVEAVAEIIADVLGLETVGADENFFLLGGHSLLGAQLIVRLGERFGVELPLRSIFINPTVAELAREVEWSIVTDLQCMSDEEATRLAAELSMDGLGASA
jgi:amino acid adenylation domain-containing protein